LAVLAAAAAAPGIASSQEKAAGTPRPESSVTLYAGHRFGGGVTDVATNAARPFSEGTAYSMALDFGQKQSADRQWQLFLSRRSSALEGSGGPGGTDIPLHITYLHVGGTYFREELGRGVYGVGGVGLTELSPQQSGLDSEIRFSGNFGAGYMIPVGKHVGLRLEGRVYLTLLNAAGGHLFCSGTCSAQAKGTFFTQAELMAGVSARF
jgi:hypothetical protein